MTWVKKMNSDWQPKEHPGILVGDVVDFPGPVQKLLEEGNIVLCDEKGNELSAYNALGIVTDRELEEFKQWKKQQQQEALKKSLEAEHEELLARAAELKAEAPKAEAAPEGTVEEAKTELDQKKKDFAARMAAAKAKKAAEKAGGQVNA